MTTHSDSDHSHHDHSHRHDAAGRTLKNLPADAGVLICGHGSRAKVAQQEFSLLAAGIRARFPECNIGYGFLEYASPNIHMALDTLVANGVNKIYAVPGMLFRATHANNDIPSVLTTYMAQHPGVEIQYGRELGLHQEMIAAFELRILQAMGMQQIPAAGALYDTMLVTVGRGTSVATANAEAARLGRIVAENLGFGWCETVYSGVTFPAVGVGLEMATKLGFKKIVVAPYFLFSGRLIGRIAGYINKVANSHPEIQFMIADYLRDSPHVINTFIVRIAELIAGVAQDDDLMADFHRRLARGEASVHHHHAEFKPEAEQHHGHHSHEHSHPPYQHIAHPFGPRSMIDENICCCFMRQFPQAVIDAERALRAAAGGVANAQTPQCKGKHQS